MSSTNGELGGDDPTGQSNTPITPAADVEVVDETKYDGFHLMAYFHCRTRIQIQIQIPFPNGYCTYFTDRFPFLLHTFRSGESESKPMEKSCIVHESLSKSGNGNKPKR